jgi:prophage regulatory protein
LTVEQVADELNVRVPQVRSLLRSGDLRGFQIGGRGLWRIGRVDLEDYIADAYRKTADSISGAGLEDDGRVDNPLGLEADGRHEC